MALRMILMVLLLAGVGSLAATELTIEKISFNKREQAGAREPWYEIAVEIDVRRGQEGEGRNSRFADDVEVEVAIAVAVPVDGELRYDFYRSRAVYPTLEVGKSVARFYLSPELVKRDRIEGEPYAFEISVSQKGESLDTAQSRRLASETSLNAFRERSQGGAAAMLWLQRDTPFAASFPSSTPHPRP